MTDLKILLVDDEVALLRSLHRGLSKRYNIDVAEGAREGLEKLALSGPYALVISDMRMPEMNGAEFLYEVQAKYPEAIRVMLTGNSDQDTAVRAVNEGSIFKFLNKPCPIKKLIETIEEALERYRLMSSKKEVLIEALNEARTAKDLQANFLANMSHEIRTPLNGIIAVGDLFSKTDLNSEQEDYLETIKTSSELLLSIINDILDFSKVDNNKIILREESFSLSDILSSLFSIIKISAKNKKLEVVINVESDVTDNLIGDGDRLKQVLLNLLGNAIKFTNVYGGVLLFVEIEKDCKEEVSLRFTVSDPGEGIPLGKQDLIFKPFIQADISSTRKYGGTGLGLSISKELVELMNGNIWVESKVGIGSSFHFTANFKKDLCYKNRDEILEDKSVLERKFKNLNILVAEDNLINQKIIKKMLKQMGFNALVVDNGKEAILNLEIESFDIVLMDIQMPILNGLEATKIIKSNKSLNVPIIALTAHALEEDREKCFNAGMDDYLTKPYKFEELKEVILRVIN